MRRSHDTPSAPRTRAMSFRQRQPPLQEPFRPAHPGHVSCATDLPGTVSDHRRVYPAEGSDIPGPPSRAFLLVSPPEETFLPQRPAGSRTIWHIVCYVRHHGYSEAHFHPYHLQGEQVVFSRPSRAAVCPQPVSGRGGTLLSDGTHEVHLRKRHKRLQDLRRFTVPFIRPSP